VVEEDANFLEGEEVAVKDILLVSREVICSQRFPPLVGVECTYFSN